MTLRENPNFLILLVAYCLPSGSFLAVGALMSNVFDPYDFLPAEIAFLSLGLLLVGVTGAVLFGLFLDKTKLYKITMHITMVLVILSIGSVVAVLTWMIESRLFKTYLVVLLIIAGFFSTGYYPLCISYGSEITFPVQPALVNGMFTLSDGISSFLFSLLGGFLIKEGRDDESLSEEALQEARRFRAKLVISMAILAALISLILSFIVKEDLKRLEYEKGQKKNEQHSQVDEDKAKQIE